MRNSSIHFFIHHELKSIDILILSAMKGFLKRVIDSVKCDGFEFGASRI